MKHTPTQGEHAQAEALRLADELEDSLESHDGSSLTARCQGIADDAAAELRRLHAQVAALTAQPAAPQGVAYAELPRPDACDGVSGAVAWSEAALRDFADRTHDLRASAGATPDVKRFYRGSDGMTENQAGDWVTYDSHIAALRASNGQAPAGAAQQAPAGACANCGDDKSKHNGVRCVNGQENSYFAPTAQAAPAAGAVAGPSVRKVFLVATGEEHEGEATYTRHDDAPPPLCDSECLYTAAPTPAAQADSITKERLKEILGKPETVHLNMLNGNIAVITMEQCAHLHGEEMQRKWAAADSVLEDAARLDWLDQNIFRR